MLSDIYKANSTLSVPLLPEGQHGWSHDQGSLRQRCDRSQSHRSRQTGKQAQPADGWGRVPLALILDRANRHDVRLLSANLDSLVISRPETTPEQLQQVYLESAYNLTPVYKKLLARHYQPRVLSRGEEKHEKESIPVYCARRWVV